MAFGNIFRVAAACAAILAVLTTTGCDQEGAQKAWDKAKDKAKAAQDAATPYANAAWNKTKDGAKAAHDAAAPLANEAGEKIKDGAKAAQEAAQPYANKAWEKTNEQWETAKNSEVVQGATKSANEAIAAAAEAATSGGKAAADAAVVKAVEVVCDKWKGNTQPFTGDYVIPPKCLLAMGVGSGAVDAPADMGAKLGFPTDGVATKSLVALWKCSTADVEDAGSLVDRLKSSGAGGLATDDHFVVTGELATSSTTFCGVADDICQGCIVKSETPPSDSHATVLYE